MGHGPHWRTLVESTDQVVEYLPDLIRDATPVDGQKRDPSAEYLYLRSKEEHLGSLGVIRNTGGETHQFVTAYPVCWDGARNELEVHSLEPIEEEDGDSFEGMAKAILRDATEVLFFCPLFQREKQLLSDHHRFVFGLGALAYSLRKADSEITITEGSMLEMERDRRKDEPGFDPASLTSVTVITSQLRYFMDRKEGDFEFQAPVEEVTPFTSRFANGKILLINLRPEDAPPLFVKLYASDRVLKGYDPQVGDPVMGVAWLQGRILETVETDERWMDSGETAHSNSSNDPMWLGVHFLYEHPELPLGMAVLGAAFVSAGWEIVSWDIALFRKGYIPMTVKKGDAKCWIFYRTFIPGFCETNLLTDEEMKSIASEAERKGVKLLDLTVRLEPRGICFRITVEGLGDLADEIHPVVEIKKPEEYKVVSLDSPLEKPDPVLDEAVAAATMARCVTERDLRPLSKMLVEDLEYTADSIGKKILGRQAYLSHVGGFLDDRQEEGTKIYGKAAFAMVGGVKRPCTMIFRNDEEKPFVCTFFTGRKGHIGSILNTVPEKLDYYELL